MKPETELSIAFSAFIGPIVERAICDAFEKIATKQVAPNTDEIGGIELAVKVTRLSKPRIYALVSERAIPHKKRGNRLYFNRAELVAWVEKGNRAERNGVIKA